MALDAISDSARIELAPRNIRVTTVYPGATATEFYTNIVDRKNADERMWKMVKAQSASHVAKKIVQAARNEPRVQYMGFSARLTALVGTMAPWLIERVVVRMSQR
jgi:short-subunit dehydrogenase